MAKLLPLFLLLLLGSALPAQEAFRIVGYLPYYRFSLSDQINFEQLTHLNIAFANPTADGQLDVGGQDITPVVATGRAHGLTVLLSMGGGLTAEWRQAWQFWMQPGNRTAYIHNIMDYVRAHDLDGVDMDLEGQDVNALYSPFVLQLRDSLAAEGKLLTAALPGSNRDPDISNAALDAFDWVNIMVYNLTGPWAPNSPGQHAPYSFAVSAINLWFSQGMPPERLTLGLPFYGWDFSSSPVSSFTYRTIVAQNPDNAFTDQAGQAYYNGIPTIQEKTRLALELLSGVMIWEIGQDSYTEYSLLNAIYETVYPPTGTETEAVAVALSVFPNPFGEELSLQNETDGALSLRLAALDGRALEQFTVESRAGYRLNTASLAPGMYVLQVLGGGAPQAYKILRY
ncbi:MAG: T9SS type A sorting domain-containing protein [Lewinellaceae bacterium]|nr:T9SS type A sorting domain-containing protein [Phaeodactylibacter sp.]MCB9035514.1 T9SS type A sorting domain-containing protein [Lewinellaceae bacterium]